MATTIDSILSRFDNGSGFTNSKGDGVIADREVIAAGGYTALANALNELQDPSDVRRLLAKLDPSSLDMRQNLAEAMAPAMAKRGMLRDGRVTADAIYGRRAEYTELRAKLTPQAAEVISETPTTTTYMQAPADVATAQLFNTSMKRVAENPTYWLTAAHAVQTHPESRAQLFKTSIAAATAPGASDVTIAYARYAAAMTARTDAERAQVLAIPAVGTNAAAQRRWLEATAIASNSVPQYKATHADAMRRAAQAGGDIERLQYLAVASRTALSPDEARAVAQEARATYDRLSDSRSQRYKYAALAIALCHLPESERAPLLRAAEADFARNPAESDSTLRQLLVQYGSDAVAADIVAGANLAYTKPAGPRKDQMLTLTASLGEFLHFY